MYPVQERPPSAQDFHLIIPGKRVREKEEGSFDEHRAKRNSNLSSAASDFLEKIGRRTPGIFPYEEVNMSVILLKILPLDCELKDVAGRLSDLFRERWMALSENARLATLTRALQQQDLEVLCSIVDKDLQAPEDARCIVRERGQLLVELVREDAPDTCHVMLFLIRNGADIEGYDGSCDKNALFWACAYGNCGLIKQLLLRGEREARVQIQHIWDDTAVRHTLGMVAEAARCYENLAIHLRKVIGNTWLLALNSLSGHEEQRQFAMKLFHVSQTNDRSAIEQMAQEALARGLIGMICPGVRDKYAYRLLRELPQQGAPNFLLRSINTHCAERVSCPVEEVFLSLINRALQRHDIDLLASLVKADTRVPDALRECVRKSGRLLVEIARGHMPEIHHVAAFLIRNGVDVEEYDVLYDRNALFWACTYGNYPLIKELLSGSAQTMQVQLERIWRDTSVRHVLGMVAEVARASDAFRQSLQQKIGEAALADLANLTGHMEQSQRALALLKAVQTQDGRAIETMLPEAVARGLSALIRDCIEAAAQEIDNRLELLDI